MTTPLDPNTFLMSGGSAAVSFPTIGTTVSGRIVATPEVRQQTDPATKEPKFFKNGDPMMQLVVQVATDERNPQDLTDDGTRAFFIKANMLNAVREAVRKTGANGLEVGGTLTVTYVADGPKTNPAFNAPKLYTAEYRPPTGQAANDLLMGNNSNQPAQPAPVGEPPAGVDKGLWAQLSPDQRASVLAASANVR
jgi:hypothetical protein